jgi:hypothetical protein
MPEDEFDYDNFASGGCVIPSESPPGCRCSGCGADAYRDEISGFDDGIIKLGQKGLLHLSALPHRFNP